MKSASVHAILFVLLSILVLASCQQPDSETIYTVTFDSRGGSAVSAQSVISGTAVVRPADPYRNQYTFTGWYDDAALTHLYEFGTAVTSNLTLYAGWKTATGGRPIYTVTFETGISEGIPSQQVISGTALVSPSVPYRESYELEGWYTDPELTKRYEFGTPVYSSFTLYANWIGNCLIRFETNGGTVLEDVHVPSWTTYTPPIPEREGYVFEGWYTDMWFEHPYDSSQHLIAGLTLYAKWTEIGPDLSEFCGLWKSSTKGVFPDGEYDVYFLIKEHNVYIFREGEYADGTSYICELSGADYGIPTFGVRLGSGVWSTQFKELATGGYSFRWNNIDDMPDALDGMTNTPEYYKAATYSTSRFAFKLNQNDGNRSYVVTGPRGDTFNHKDLVLPDNMLGIPVTGIEGLEFGDWGFVLTDIPEGYTFIGDCALSRVGVPVLDLPSTMRELGSVVFAPNDSMTEANLNEGLKIIGDQAFMECLYLEEIKIPSSVKEVGMRIFEDCPSLHSIYVNWPDGNRPDGWSEEWLDYCNATVYNYDGSVLIQGTP